MDLPHTLPDSPLLCGLPRLSGSSSGRRRAVMVVIVAGDPPRTVAGRDWGRRTVAVQATTERYVVVSQFRRAVADVAEIPSLTRAKPDFVRAWVSPVIVGDLVVHSQFKDSRWGWRVQRHLPC